MALKAEGKIKVLVDIGHLNTALTGIKTYMLEFIQAVKESPPDGVEFVFSHDVNDQLSNSFFRGHLPIWKKLFYHAHYFWYKQIKLPLLVKQHQPSILLCFDFVGPAISLPVHKLIVIHDAFFWQMPHNYQSWWRVFFIEMIKQGLKGKSTVITTSNYSKKSIQQALGEEQPIEVIYQCPKLLEGNEESEILDSIDLKEKKYFLHVGTFDRRKLIPVLVEAFGQFEKEVDADFRLVLVGSKGLSEHLDDRPKVKALVKEMGLEEKVLLPGFLDEASLKTLYQNAFSYVFPSSNEGFGIPVIEAMANEIPVIISDQEALIEVAGGAALVSEVGNSQGLFQKMKELYLDSELQKSLIEKGRQRKSDFSREKFLQPFLKLIQKVN